jgi:hypothetical protein
MTSVGKEWRYSDDAGMCGCVWCYRSSAVCVCCRRVLQRRHLDAVAHLGATARRSSFGSAQCATERTVRYCKAMVVL